MCSQSGDKYFLILVVTSLFQTLSKTKYSHKKCLCTYKLKWLSHLGPWRFREDVLCHTSLTVIQGGFTVISKKGRCGLEARICLEVSGSLCTDWLCTVMLFVCLLIITLRKRCPSVRHLGTWHLEEVADPQAASWFFWWSRKAKVTS